MWLILLITVVAFEIIADVLSKQWSMESKNIFLIGGIVFYLLANIAWLWALKYGAGLARGVAVFSVLGAIIAMIIGIVFYKESVSNIQTAGLVLGILSLVLIFWSDIF